MAKAYWVVCYHSIKNQDAFQAYAKLAAPAIQAAGGKYLVRGNPAKVYESGMNQRVVLIEFASVQQALAAHDAAGYQEALKHLAADGGTPSGQPRCSASGVRRLGRAQARPSKPRLTLKRGGENPRPAAIRKSLDPQRFVRQVFLPVGLEIDAVGRLDLLLFPDRFLREAREARFDFGGQRLAAQRLRVLERARQPEAGVGIFISLAHLGEDTRRGQGLGMLHGLGGRRERAAVRGAAVRRIQGRRDRRALGEHLGAPLAQLDHVAVAVQPQAGLAAARRGAQLVAPDRS